MSGITTGPTSALYLCLVSCRFWTGKLGFSLSTELSSGKFGVMKISELLCIFSRICADVFCCCNFSLSLHNQFRSMIPWFLTCCFCICVLCVIFKVHEVLWVVILSQVCGARVGILISEFPVYVFLKVRTCE